MGRLQTACGGCLRTPAIERPERAPGGAADPAALLAGLSALGGAEEPARGHARRARGVFRGRFRGRFGPPVVPDLSPLFGLGGFPYQNRLQKKSWYHWGSDLKLSERPL